MNNSPKIILPHGGFRKLIVYKKSDIIYQGTVAFCRRFLPMHGDRTVDQMIQAARSCKQNIAEGSAASGTSKETELRLTNVARASLVELLEDFYDHLKITNTTEWDLNDKRKIAARQYAKTYEEWDWWKTVFETRDETTIVNLMIVFINQAQYLLNKMIVFQEKDFASHGGIRERMHDARTVARSVSWEKAVFSYLEMANNERELTDKTREIQETIDRMARKIALNKGWIQA